MTDRFKEALDDLNSPYTIWKPNENFKRHAIPDKHLNTLLEALTLATEVEQLREYNDEIDEAATNRLLGIYKLKEENEQLRKEVSELSTQKQGLIGVSDGKSDIIKLLESRIALLETFIESRGYDVPV